MDFEAILTEVGDFGRYQKKLIGYFMVPTTLISSLYVMNLIFMVSVPDHWCHVPELAESNLTLEQKKYLSLPITVKDGKERFSQCKMYDIDYKELIKNLTWKIEAGPTPIEPDTPTIRCTSGWTYDTSRYQTTAVSQWDLVCEHDQLPSLVLTLANVGSAIGTFAFGYTADKFGRRAAFFSNIALAAVSGTISVLSPNFACFAIMRMLTGAALPANFQLPYIISVEQVGSKPRSWLVCLSWVLWTLGGCFLPLIAYLTGNYVTLGLITTLPLFMAFGYWRYLPASPRFLLTRKRFPEVERSVLRIARENGKKPPDNLQQKLMKIGQTFETEAKEVEMESISGMWRYPQLRKKVLIVTVNWCAIAVSYFGLIINISNLGGNEFLNYFLLSFIELPSFLIACYVMQRWGRRWATTSFVGIAGISCLVPVFAPGVKIVAIVSSLIGKFGSAAAFMVIYQQATELYPTPVRALGLSIGSTVSSLAIIFMPYVVYLGVYNRVIPFLILGAICMIAAIISPLVPETLNEKLPQTIAESEAFGVQQHIFSCARRKQSTGNENGKGNEDLAEHLTSV